MIDSGKIWHVFDNDLPCIIHLTGEGAPLHRLLTVRHHYLVVSYKKTSPLIESHRCTKKIKALINIMSICLLGETKQNMLQRRTLKWQPKEIKKDLQFLFYIDLWQWNQKIKIQIIYTLGQTSCQDCMYRSRKWII